MRPFLYLWYTLYTKIFLVDNISHLTQEVDYQIAITKIYQRLSHNYYTVNIKYTPKSLLYKYKANAPAFRIFFVKIILFF